MNPLLRRSALALAVVLPAALLAVACGGGDKASGGDGRSGIAGDDGPLTWMPKDTWAVLSVRIDEKPYDRAAKTLARLPIWSLIGAAAPVSDGASVRTAALDALGDELGEDDGDVTAQDLEDVVGDRAGGGAFGKLAATDGSKGGDSPSVVAWFELQDEGAAAKLLEEGGAKSRKHEGHDYFETKSGSAALVEDDLLLLGMDADALEAAIDAREGESFGDDETNRGFVEAAVGDAPAGAMVDTDVLLANAAKAAAKDAKSGKMAEKLLDAALFDDLVPDRLGMSLDIDAAGLQLRGTWSNPRDLADPKVDARELVERMPEQSVAAQAFATDGTPVRRAQELWSTVRTGIDMDEAVASCGPEMRALCGSLLSLVAATLEDEGLADAAEAGDDRVLGSATYGTVEKGEATSESVMSGDPFEWTPSGEVTSAASDAGLFVTRDGDAYTVRIDPKSPLGTALAMSAKQGTNQAALAASGFDAADLFDADGITMSPERVDDLLVATSPVGATSLAAKSLAGDGDTVKDGETYGTVVDAADPPREVGAYAFYDLRALVEQALDQLGGSSETLKQAMPTITTNLEHAPGVLAWSSRETVRDEEVGVMRLVLPIVE